MIFSCEPSHQYIFCNRDIFTATVKDIQSFGNISYNLVTESVISMAKGSCNNQNNIKESSNNKSRL